MAQSPSHKLGQIVGDLFEECVREPLEHLAEEHGMYLDYQHSRPARNGKRRVEWTDWKGNAHVLDYVFEEGGTEEAIGVPRGFVEIAWRRYTKHSRNKTQEIQGAVLPLAETHRNSLPFLGAVLAGEFTDTSTEQLRSHGFHLVHCPYETLVLAFAAEGANISYDEDTSDTEMADMVQTLTELTSVQYDAIARNIRDLHRPQFDEFLGNLAVSLSRRVASVGVLALSGVQATFNSIDEAIRYVADHDHSRPSSDFVRYEVRVKYTSGDEVGGSFTDKGMAIGFLRMHVA